MKGVFRRKEIPIEVKKMSIEGFPSDPLIQKTESNTNSASEKTVGALKDLAAQLPEKLPFPFSGKIAFEVGDGPLIEAAYFPWQPPVPEGCPFNVLSVGKLFTSVAVMQLIGDSNGKITLKTPLSDLLTPEEMDLKLRPPYLKDKPTPENIKRLQENAHKITVGDLLSHRSGLTLAQEEGPEDFFDAPENIEHPYSNYGFQLLASIIGKHSREGNPDNYEDGFCNHIKERIFRPAGMDGAINELDDPYQGSKPDQFKVNKEDGSCSIDESQEPYPHGNGCWRMQPKDLCLFGQALRHYDTLISEKTFNEMLEREPPLGFMVNRDEKTKVIIGYGHPGSGPGSSSFLHTWLTDPPITATVLSNYSNGSNVKPFLDPIIPSLMNR